MNNRTEHFNAFHTKKRVLLVEDELVNREILRMILSEDYDVIAVESGEQALEEVREQHDVLSTILLDLNLPGISGIEVLKTLKADSAYARIPVIVLTADSEAEVECLTLGATDFIPKPYPQPKVILARILRTIELYEDRDIIRHTEKDSVTGLYNKEFFYRYVLQRDTYLKNDPTDAIVLDVNHFHTINDRYGKAHGDEILKRIGEKMLALAKQAEGIVCRSEADTFMFYCPHRSDYASILDNLSISLEGDKNSDHRVRLRMGVYADVDKTLDIERRFDRAKMAANTVKDNLAAPIGYYDHSMYEAELLEEQLIDDFPAAIQEKQFVVFYQPKYAVQPDEPVLSSAEALVRWKHPKLGMVSPGVFIPLFEKNGLIQTLDHYIWAEAAAQIRDWKERLNIVLPVSVNVSRVDLYDPKLVDTLLEIVRENGLKNEELLLEVTESAYTNDARQIIEKVKQLRKLGIRIEMDDFGSGYSSLSMLSYMPIDALKLDMQFIRSAFRDRKDTRLLEAMIRLAASFEVPTIAEGVETAEQVFTLKMMGCDIIQGYYFSRPLPADEFEEILTAGQKPSAETESKKRAARRDDFIYNALHDPATGLYNYSAFEILFRDSDQAHIAVMIVNVGGYDALKRAEGYAGADRLACKVADTLRRNFRSVDHICRIREDEFVVIVTRVAGKHHDPIFSKIEKIYFELQDSDDGQAAIPLRVGVAFSNRSNPCADVFDDADAALDQMRESSASGYCVFDGTDPGKPVIF